MSAAGLPLTHATVKLNTSAENATATEEYETREEVIVDLDVIVRAIAMPPVLLAETQIAGALVCSHVESFTCAGTHSSVSASRCLCAQHTCTAEISTVSP